jgi:hypothetical protein
MGYGFSVYGVDLAKLQPVWGSKNARLAAAIKSKQAEELAGNDEWFSDEIEEGAPSLASALDEIIAGKATKKKHGFQYGYALERLCAHMGKRIDDSDLSYAFDQNLDPLLKKVKQPRTAKLLCTGVLPLAIPRPSDFPVIGTIDAPCMAILARALDAVEPAIPEDDDDELGIAWVIAELRGWIRRARRSKKAIVWFAY